MEYPCVRLGKFGRPMNINAGVCMKGLHRLVVANVGHDTSGHSFCRACRDSRRARWYWARRLQLYWVAMGVTDGPEVPVTAAPSLPITIGGAGPPNVGGTNGRPLPNRVREDRGTTADQTTEVGWHPHFSE